MRSCQREWRAAGLTRQCELAQAEMTSQRPKVITPADEAALPVIVRAAVAGLVRRDPAQADGSGRLVDSSPHPGPTPVSPPCRLTGDPSGSPNSYQLSRLPSGRVTTSAATSTSWRWPESSGHLLEVGKPTKLARLDAPSQDKWLGRTGTLASLNAAGYPCDSLISSTPLLLRKAPAIPRGGCRSSTPSGPAQTQIEAARQRARMLAEHVGILPNEPALTPAGSRQLTSANPPDAAQ